MILELFIALMALSGLVIVLGYFTGDEPYLVVGLFFFFILGVIILSGDLEYETGAVVNSTIVDTSTTTTSIQYNFTSWDDTASHRVGWGLSIISFLGLALALYNIRKGRREEE